MFPLGLQYVPVVGDHLINLPLVGSPAGGDLVSEVYSLRKRHGRAGPVHDGIGFGGGNKECKICPRWGRLSFRGILTFRTLWK